VARPRPAAAAESSTCERGNAVGLTFLTWIWDQGCIAIAYVIVCVGVAGQSRMLSGSGHYLTVNIKVEGCSTPVKHRRRRRAYLPLLDLEPVDG